MNVYLFSAAVIREGVNAHGGSYLSEGCVDSIVGADTLEKAQELFEASLQVGDKEVVRTNIQRIVATPFMDQILAESGRAPIDWARACQAAEAKLEVVSEDDSEQGYWLDVNEIVRPGPVAASVEALQRALPEDVRSGLNWSPDKTFLFIVILLSPQPEPAGTLESMLMYNDPEKENGAGVGAADTDESLNALPEMAEKESAVVVEARNAAVAAWLWQRFSGSAPLGAKKLQLSPWLPVLGLQKT